MIATELYKGQGLGNQLWCYVVTRVIAKDKGYDFGIKSPENFKGLDFMNLNFGEKVIGGSGPEGGPPETLPKGITFYYNERKVIHPLNGCDIRICDQNLVNISDNTKIDGCMQDEQYIVHRKDEVKRWLRVQKEHEFYKFSDDNICIINFRGGEYAGVKDFFLPQKYWDDAIANMLKINKNFKFIVITDDTVTAKKFFPKFLVCHFNIAKDYVIIKNAKYLILSNSTFAWFPAWLSEKLKFCIAPKYWGRHNISDGFWSLGYNLTTGWYYQDRQGKLYDYQSCLSELKAYIKRNSSYYPSKKTDKYYSVYNPDFVKRMVVDANNCKSIRKKFFLGKKITPKEIVKTISVIPTHKHIYWGKNSLTMLPWSAIENISRCCEDVIRRKIEGDFVETGVWRGGACIVAKSIFDYWMVNKKVFAADSFEGLPKPDYKKFPDDQNDKHYLDNSLKVSLEKVKKNFKKFGCLDNRVIFLKGWFKDTMLSASIEKISILRLDGDMYESTIQVLENLYHKLSLGGYCIIDDYYHRGCQLAVQDFRSLNGITESIIKVDNNPENEVHYWIKEKNPKVIHRNYPKSKFARSFYHSRNKMLALWEQNLRFMIGLISKIKR